MLSTWLLTLISFSIVSSIIPYSHGYLNLYLNRQEVKRLIGAEHEIYYIKEGQVDDYALSFIINIKPNIPDLHFTWQCLIKTPMPYSISLQMDDLTVLGIPHINISQEGFVPTKEQVFWIGLPCIGNKNAEVNITINITLLLFERYAFLNLRRNKICHKALAHSMLEENDSMLSVASPKNSSVQSIYMALACFCLLCFLFVDSSAGFVSVAKEVSDEMLQLTPEERKERVRAAQVKQADYMLDLLELLKSMQQDSEKTVSHSGRDVTSVAH